jgi:hypothetical protein
MECRMASDVVIYDPVRTDHDRGQTEAIAAANKHLLDSQAALNNGYANHGYSLQCTPVARGLDWKFDITAVGEHGGVITGIGSLTMEKDHKVSAVSVIGYNDRPESQPASAPSATLPPRPARAPTWDT